jgi:hypothetical protein
MWSEDKLLQRYYNYHYFHMLLHATATSMTTVTLLHGTTAANAAVCGWYASSTCTVSAAYRSGFGESFVQFGSSTVFVHVSAICIQVVAALPICLLMNSLAHALVATFSICVSVSYKRCYHRTRTMLTAHSNTSTLYNCCCVCTAQRVHTTLRRTCSTL